MFALTSYKINAGSVRLNYENGLSFDIPEDVFHRIFGALLFCDPFDIMQVYGGSVNA